MLQDQRMTALQPNDKVSLLSLPDEIVVYILANVPGKDLISFQRASIQLMSLMTTTIHTDLPIAELGVQSSSGSC